MTTGATQSPDCNLNAVLNAPSASRPATRTESRVSPTTLRAALPHLVSEAKRLIHAADRTGMTRSRLDQLRNIGEHVFEAGGLHNLDEVARRITGLGERAAIRRALLAQAWDGIGEAKRRWWAA